MSLPSILLLVVFSFVAGLITAPLLKRARLALRRPKTTDSVASPVDKLHYARKTGQFALLPARGEITFLGDSRIEYADWNEVLGRSDISNRGISGDTTGGIAQRLSVSLAGRVSVCVLQAGVNDLWRGVPDDVLRQNYQQILRYIVEEKKADLIVTSVVFVDQARMALNARIASLNQILREMCQRPGLHWLDLNRTLAPAGYLEPRFTDDGTHFTGEAYQAIGELLRMSLEAVLAQRKS